MTPYQLDLLSQTTDFEMMAGIIYLDLYEENMEAWELIGDTEIDIHKPLQAREILEKIAKEIINNDTPRI